jgi:putative hydrolase of the HAD superfamily
MSGLCSMTQRMPSRITTVLLDADGVVQTTAAGWLDAVAALSGRPDDRDEFLAEVFAAEKPTLTGAGAFRPALAEVLARWQSPATVDEAIEVWQMIEPQMAILETADALRRRGLRVGLATNQQPERAAFMAHGLGYQARFDDLFFSCELGQGHAKPDGAYFHAVIEQLAQPAAEVLFVDDSHGNVAAAQAAGLHAQVYDLDTGRAGMLALLAEFGLTDG